MPILQVELSDLLYQCLATDCADPQEWATNCVLNRARMTYDSLFLTEIQRRFAVGEPILQDKDANLADAFSRGIIQTIQQRIQAAQVAQTQAEEKSE